MRVKTIQAGKKEVILVDCSNLNNDKDVLFDTLKEGSSLVATKPDKSVYIITNVKDSKVDTNVSMAFKQYALTNTPYIKESVVVGLNSMQHIIFNVIKTLTKRNFQLADTMEEAIKYMESVA